MSVATLFNTLHERGLLSDEDHKALSSTLSTRGKYKGNLRSSLPKGDTERGAWRAMMSNCAPQRAGLFSLMIAPEGERKAFDYYDGLLTKLLHGRERVVLGVIMPLRFNLLAYHYECNDIPGLIDTLANLHNK